MKIVCKQENLIKGLVKVSHLTGKNFNLPILNNILIRVEKGNIELSATNLEMGVKTQIRGKVEGEGRITVPAKIVTDYIALIDSDKNIELEIKDDNLIISSDGWQTKVKTSPAEDYPLIPDVEKKNEFSLKLQEFKKSVSSVIYSASVDETRPELTGVLFWAKAKEFILVATDSYRLAEKKTKLEETVVNEIRFVVPLKTMQELVRIMGDDESEQMNIFFDESQVVFFYGETKIVSRLIESEYPDYNQIIPTDFVTELELEVGELIKAIKASSLFTKSGIFDVSLEFKEDGLTINSINSQLGENTIKLGVANFKGQTQLITFNYKYLLDGLNNMNASKVKIKINSNSNPCVIRPIGNEEYMYLVMPIRQ